MRRSQSRDVTALATTFLAILPVAVGILTGPAVTAEQQPGVGQGDAAQGEQIAMHGGQCSQLKSNCMPCFQCHSAKGAGSQIAEIPKLAGLPYDYIEKALMDFQKGARSSAIMEPIADGLDAQSVRDLAAFFAEAEPDSTSAEPQPDLNVATLERGALLAEWGDEQRRVPACNNCHGPGGEGLAPSQPFLAGQYAEYLLDQLQKWRNGSRTGDSLNMMRGIAMSMSEQQIADVTNYYAALGSGGLPLTIALGAAIAAGPVPAVPTEPKESAR